MVAVITGTDFPRRHSAPMRGESCGREGRRLAEVAGGLPRVLPEDFAEVLAGGEARCQGDLGDRLVGVGQEFFSHVDAAAQKIVVGSHAGSGFKQVEDSGPAIAEMVDQIRDPQRFLAPRLQERFGCRDDGAQVRSRRAAQIGCRVDEHGAAGCP
ncbi:MAG: hypothetical protein WCP12_04405 [bacterium]